MQQHRLFARARIQLAGFYAIVIGLISLSCGYAIHVVMMRAFTRTVDRELNTLVGTVHDALEAVLAEPEVISPAAMRVLPGLCVANRQCSLTRPNSKLAELTQTQGYILRLLNLQGRELAHLGSTSHKFNVELPTLRWENINDNRGNRYHLHTLPLKTIDDRDWGYIQVAQSYRLLDEYMQNFHLLLIVGIPLTMLAIGTTSWWLSGLAMQPLDRSYQQIQQFTADAAHELRTPLAVTRVAVENALELTLDPDRVRSNLEIVHKHLQRLGRLAEDLLWLSRWETERRSSQQQLCCLHDLVSDLEEELAPLALAAKVDLRLEIRNSQSCYAIGDIDKLYRAIANLVDNAIHSTAADGTVTICLECSHDRAIVTVSDTGSGIAADDLPHIFDRFYRAGTDRARATGGTGLGLAIAKAIVNSHHGSIHVSSQLGVGSVFTVRLPTKISRT
jgi:signal transduction histidine kinase